MFLVEYRPKVNLKASNIIFFNLKDLVTLVSLFIKYINIYYSNYSNI
jgi:hypothetical protein